jgi:hypothetical protein
LRFCSWNYLVSQVPGSTLSRNLQFESDLLYGTSSGQQRHNPPHSRAPWRCGGCFGGGPRTAAPGCCRGCGRRCCRPRSSEELYDLEHGAVRAAVKRLRPRRHKQHLRRAAIVRRASAATAAAALGRRGSRPLQSRRPCRAAAPAANPGGSAAIAGFIADPTAPLD